VRTVEHVADLRRRPGAPRPVGRAVPAAALGDLATTTSLVPAGSDVELDAVAEATGADIVVTGTLSFDWEGECRRCLRPVAGRVEADLREVFTPQPVEGETWPVEGDTIDLGPVLREAVLLALPLVPLCSDDCAGPDPERFPAVVEGDGPRDEPPGDPRWSALDQLRFDRPPTSPGDSGDR